MDESSEGYWAKTKYNIYRECVSYLPLRSSDMVFRVYTGHQVHIKMKTDVTIQCNSQTARLRVYFTR